MNKFKRNILLIGLVSSFSLLGAASLPIPSSETPSGPTYATKLPTTIDLNDSTETEIRNYYSSLNTLEASERNGNNLLKNLKPILQDFDYYTYDNVWKIYEITDRDWNLSPAASDNSNGITYDSSTNTYTKYSYLSNAKSDAASNPYVHTLYRNVDENGSIVEAGRIKEWGDHNASGTNREHVWCQSRGFKAPSGAEGPAGTDVHHLISGDGLVNQSYHNNNPYGFVKKDDASTKNAGDQKAWLNGNYLGPQLHAHNEDQANVVFEPQDSDKGDIARALFYMAACYNNFSGNDTITDYNPNLLLVNYATDNGAAESSSATHPVCMGILSDLLEWHKMDPVDEYEIHRNNLIYKNFQHNRNPFIDFPEWVDMVWGENASGLSANPATDKIASGQKGPITVTPSTLSLTLDETDTRKEGTIKVKADIDDELVCEVKDDSLIEVLRAGTYTTDGINETHYTVLSKGKTGSTTITFKGHKDGQEVSATCTVTIHETEKMPEPDDDGNPIMSMLRGIFGDAAPVVLVIAIVLIVVIIILVLVLVLKNKKTAKKARKTAKKAYKANNKRRK